MPATLSSNRLNYSEFDNANAPEVWNTRQDTEALEAVTSYCDDPEFLNLPRPERYGATSLAIPSKISVDELSGKLAPWSTIPVTTKSTDILASQVWHLRARMWAVVVICVIVAGAIAGGVGGYYGHQAAVLHQNHNTSAGASTDSGSSSPNATATTGNSGDAPVPSSTATARPAPVANPAYALNGTSIYVQSYNPSSNGDTTLQNYVVFYQHSSGDLRKIVYNESAWHPSEFVTSGARIGTGLGGFYMESSGRIELFLYYIDQSGYLQELRGYHASNVWNNGTLGAAQVQVSNNSSQLSATYVGACSGDGLGWIYYQSAAGLREVRWSMNEDTWYKLDQQVFPDLVNGTGVLALAQADGYWAFAITQGLNLQEFVCQQCCQNSSNTWEPGLTATTLDNSPLNLAGSIVGGPRFVYYQDPFSNIHELINTGNDAGDNSPEFWVSNQTVNGQIVQNITSQASSTGTVVTSAMQGSQLSMITGFRGLSQQVFLFYQQNGSDITARVRDVQFPGQWGTPVALPVGE